jgi:predicted RNA-binding protein with PIN domain
VRWLIDGYNVIRRDADLRAAEQGGGLHAGRAALLRLVAGAARRHSDHFTVVFDGAPGVGPAESPGQVEVIFSRPPEKADDVLMRLARQSGDGDAVVSDDRTVADAARRARCAAISAADFVAALSGGDSGADEKDEDEDDIDEPKRGNPRRLSKDARAAQRALRRLRGR